MNEHRTRPSEHRRSMRQSIKDSARHMLVSNGAASLNLTAVARSLGVTTPALYRYFTDLDDIVQHLATDLVTELVGHMTDAVRPEDGLATQLRNVTLAFREWSVAHTHEFGLLFGMPTTAVRTTHLELSGDWMVRLAEVWGPLFITAWHQNDFPIRDDAQLPPELVQQISNYRDALGRPELPVGMLVVFLDCWRQIYGAVCLEVFGHMGTAITDHEPLFRTMVNDLLARLGFPDYQQEDR